MTSNRAPDPRSASPSIFDRLVWKQDRVLLDDIAFRFEDFRESTWELGEECLSAPKGQADVGSVRSLLANRADVSTAPNYGDRIFDGGSVAFWNEFFRLTSLSRLTWRPVVTAATSDSTWPDVG